MSHRSGSRTEPVFPVALLSRGQRCVVVGGGEVGARKVSLLVQAEADVTVVSPELCQPIATLVSAGRVVHVARAFRAEDVEGTVLVYAATNDPNVNARILDTCRQQGVLCCRVDAHWADGHFVTPATVRSRGLTVSVSTGGQSCRRSRLVQGNLARHIEMIDTSDLVVVGTSHEQLSLRERARYHLVGERRDKSGRMLMQVLGINEFVLLNTCNRVELFAAISKETAASGILQHALGFDHLPRNAWYMRHGYEAFEHACLLTAGLYSQTPGENHIVAQVKEALSGALAAGWAGGLMDEWISHALHVSKHARQEVAPLLRDFEIEDLCLDYLSSHDEELAGKRVAVLGSGVVGTAMIRRCIARGLVCDWYYRSTPPEPPLVDGKGGRRIHIDELRHHIGEADAIVCTTASADVVLHREHLPFLRLAAPLHIVDLSSPRNVEPELAGSHANLRIADLDDLKHWYRREAADLSAIFDISRRIVHEHRDLYDRLAHSFQGGISG